MKTLIAPRIVQTLNLPDVVFGERMGEYSVRLVDDGAAFLAERYRRDAMGLGAWIPASADDKVELLSVCLRNCLR